MSSQTLTADEQVEAGALLLDTYNAGDWDWRSDINVAAFDMESWDDCVIGQVFSDIDFDSALALIGCTNRYLCGFMGYDRNNWRDLQDAWIREIER